MVASIINNKVKFTETPDIEDEDIEHSSDVFELDLFNASKTISVVLGKPKYTYSHENVVYLPIYAISKDSLVGKIGVFEFTPRQIINLYQNGDIDLAKLSPPILFSDYEEADQLDALGADPAYYHKISAIDANKDANKDAEVIEDDDNTSGFRVEASAKAVSMEKQKSMSKLKSGIFTISTGFTEPDMLTEESEKDAEYIRTHFIARSENNWIEERMQNNNYTILENESSGDCFFAAVRDAYAQIGRITTVEKLRAILANELTDEVFQENMKLDNDFESQKKENEFQIDELSKQLASLKKETESDKYTKNEIKVILSDAKEIVRQIKVLKLEIKELNKIRGESIGFMKGIKTIDDMRANIKTQSFWADTWAIMTLERVLNMKTLIMSQDVYSQGDKLGVLQCGEATKEMQDKGIFSPEFYIITTLGNNHYRLVNYKNKGILKFSEVPYDLKALVVNKCLENTAGVFYLVQDFRNFKTRLGLDAELGAPKSYLEDGMGDIFDESVAFTFYSTAAKGPKPGLGDGERIPESSKAKFLSLAKIDEWRKKLDDTWDKAILTIDNHKWASVEHYVQGTKYKKGFPDVYLMFSLDSESEISRDIKKAKGPAKGPHKGLKDGLRIDTDYALGRYEQERDMALKAKFIDNLDMKHLLTSTGRALLLHKEGVGNELRPDIALMKLRSGLA
jgi:hypothetical protein